MEAWQEQQIYEETLRKVEEERRLQLIEKLKPAFGKDGNQFYFLLGENLQEGIAGFGDTVADAVSNFFHNYNNEKIAIVPKKQDGIFETLGETFKPKINIAGV
jgi:hypothetical protein